MEHGSGLTKKKKKLCVERCKLFEYTSKELQINPYF